MTLNEAVAPHYVKNFFEFTYGQVLKIECDGMSTPDANRRKTVLDLPEVQNSIMGGGNSRQTTFVQSKKTQMQITTRDNREFKIKFSKSFIAEELYAYLMSRCFI